MSGGEYGYAWQYAQSVADQVLRELVGKIAIEPEEQRELMHKDREHIALFLSLVATALRELELYDSDDTSDWQIVRSAFARCVSPSEPAGFNETILESQPLYLRAYVLGALAGRYKYGREAFARDLLRVIRDPETATGKTKAVLDLVKAELGVP